MVSVGTNVLSEAVSVASIYVESRWSLALWVGTQEPILFPAPCDIMDLSVWYTVGVLVSIQNDAFSAKLHCTSFYEPFAAPSNGYLWTIQALTAASVYLGQPSPGHSDPNGDPLFEDSSMDLLGLVVVNYPMENEAFQELVERVDSLLPGHEALSPP